MAPAPLTLLLIAAIVVALVAWVVEGATGWPIDAIVIATVALLNGTRAPIEQPNPGTWTFSGHRTEPGMGPMPKWSEKRARARGESTRIRATVSRVGRAP